MEPSSKFEATTRALAVTPSVPLPCQRIRIDQEQREVEAFIVLHPFVVPTCARPSFRTLARALRQGEYHDARQTSAARLLLDEQVMSTRPMLLRNRLFHTALSVFVVAGCAQRAVEPNLASSATSPGYAERFPADLNATQRQFVENERRARELMQKFDGYPGALQPVPANAAAVVRYADEEGRGAAYVERLERVETVARFFEDEKDALRMKVAGAAQYAAKQKNCEADVGSPAAFALEKTVEERLEESLHEASDAHALIDRDEKKIGAKNAEVLREQADEIAQASYLAYVGVVRSKVRLLAMLEELDRVKETLERTGEDLSRLEQDGALDEAARAQVAEQRAAVADARRRIDVERGNAESLSKQMEERIDLLQKDHEKALDGLLKALEAASGSAR